MTVAAAGDVACDPTDANYNGGLGTASACRQRTVGTLIQGMGASKVFALGDLQYPDGSLSSFNTAYDSAWGAFKSSTVPVIGNHEYVTPGAAGYFGYFGSAAPPTGYSSFDIPVGASKWHVVNLNSECATIDGGVGCAVGSPQYNWLRNDLASNRTLCTAVLVHRPRWASHATASAEIAPLFDLLYQYRADLVLAGHVHVYERFAPQNAAGKAVDDGMRQIIVGTGGKSFGTFGTTAANSEVRKTGIWGALKLSLTETGYGWNYVASSSTPFTDSGSGTCHDPQDTTAPSVPQDLATAAAPTSSSVALGWSASTDTSGVAGYRIYRSDVTGGPLNSALVTQPAYTDTTVTPSTTYSYSVSAVDVAGNESARSTAVSVATPASSAAKTLTFTPSSDTTVDSSHPTTNYGGSNRLTADGSPATAALLKFNVVGTSGCTVTSAKLRLTVGSSSSDGSVYGGDLYGVSDTSWSGSTVTWNTRPAASATKVSSIANAVSLNSTYLLDATTLVKGDGLVSMQLSSANGDAARYWSKEGSTAAQAPQLQVTCSGTSTADTTAPTTPGSLTGKASSASKVDLTWVASSDDTAVTGYRVYRNGASTPLASLPGTALAYSDGSVSAGTSYTYEVSAVDAAANESARATVTVTTPSSTPMTLTFAPTSDTTVDSSHPTTTYGASTRLIADGSPTIAALLKFNVTGTAGCTVTSAKLRLTVGSSASDDSVYGGDLYGVSDTSWSGTTVTWDTRPPADTTKVASIADAVSLNTTYLIDATALVKGDGLVSMQLSTTNGDAARYWSKEGSTAAQAPQLQVTCG